MAIAKMRKHFILEGQELQGSEEDINRFVAELEKGRYVQVEKRIVKDLPLVEDEVGFKVLE